MKEKYKDPEFHVKKQKICIVSDSILSLGNKRSEENQRDHKKTLDEYLPEDAGSEFLLKYGGTFNDLVKMMHQRLWALGVQLYQKMKLQV